MAITQNIVGLRLDKLTGFIGFAVSISILINSLIPLMLVPWESMLRGIAGLGLILLEIIGFMELMKVLSLSTLGLNFAGIVGFTFSIAILINSLIPFMLAPWDAMLRGIVGLGLVMSELIGFMLLVTYLPIGTSSLGRFTGFAASIGILMLSLIPLMITDWNGMIRAVTGLGLVLLEIIGFMELMKVLSLSTLGLNFAGFAGFTAAIGILMLSLIPFMSTDWGGVLKAVTALGFVILEIIGFMELMKVLSLSTLGLNFAGILGFTLSIAVLILAIKSFASMEWDEWARSLAGLGIVLAEIIGFMALAQTVTYNAAAIGMVVAICLSVGIMALLLSAAMNEVRNLKWEVITAFTAGMSTVIISLALAIAALSAIPFGAGVKGIALLAVGVAALLGVIALLGPMVIESFGNSFAQLSGKLELISGTLKGFADRMGSIDEGNISKANGIFDQLKRLLGKLAGWGKFTGDLNNFSYAMFVLGTGMEIFNNHVGNTVTSIDSNAQAALKFVTDLSGCANDLDTISRMNMDGLISAIAGLGGAMSIYAYGAQQIQGMLAPGETPDPNTVNAAMEIMKAISDGLAETGGFTIPDNMPDDSALTLFGASLAALAGAMVQFEQAGSGLGAGTDKALEVITFFEQLKRRLTNPSFGQNLGEAIGVFEKQKIDKDKLTEFGVNIEQLGLALSSFNNSVTVLDESTGDRKAIDFSNAISTLDSLVALQGRLGWDFGPIIQFFAGRRKDFTDLGGEIESLGTALQDFNTKLGGVDEVGNPKLDAQVFEDAISIVDKVTDYLLEMSTKMGRVGGLWNILKSSFIGREYNFEDIKYQIVNLADGLGSLGQLKVDDKLITTDDTTGMFSAVDAILDYLISLKDKFGRVGGLINGLATAIVGRDYNFTDLKVQLTALGEGLQGLSVFDPGNLPTKENMEAAFPMIDSLLEYMNTLKSKISEGDGSVGGLYNIVNTALHGRSFNFEDLGTQLSKLGEGLGSISGITIDANGNSVFSEEGREASIETIDALITYMTTLESKLGTVGGIAQFFSKLWNGKDADFQYVGTQLGYLGDGLGKFQQGITANGSFDAAQVSSALGALDHLISMMQTFSVLDEKMDAISQSYGLSSYTMKDFFVNMWDSLYLMTNGADGRGSAVELLADFVKSFDSELSELGGLDNAGSTDILNSVAQSISTLVTAARNMQNEDGTLIDFQLVGTNIASGIAAGIAGATGVVEAAARAVVRAAVDAANAEADSHSPSRVFMTVGGFMGQGLALGLIDQKGNVGDAAAEVTDQAIESAGGIMAQFASLMSQEIDANPTITPVIDLTNITAGANAINDMLTGEKRLSLAGAGSSYSESSIPRNDKGTSEYRGQDLSGVYSAISRLGDRIDVMSSRISNMQIVMNTGVLVGEVTDGVNKNLGAKTTYNRRRN